MKILGSCCTTCSECSIILPLLRVDVHQYLCHYELFTASGRSKPCPILLYKEKQLQSKTDWFEIRRILRHKKVATTTGAIDRNKTTYLVEWTNSEQTWLSR
eukprot:GILK01039265.1.p2 GENE.GILK01039265.1~~GILK01039265.1.p2  ORF type:complete len:101 (+),score=8.41 GILK01039265.1:258-560(+)